MHGSCYPSRYAGAVSHRMECVVRDEIPHSGYCRYSWDHYSLLDYPGQGNPHQAQLAPSCPGYDNVAPATTELATPGVVRRVSETGSSSPAETVLDSGKGGPLSAAAL